MTLWRIVLFRRREPRARYRWALRWLCWTPAQRFECVKAAAIYEANLHRQLAARKDRKRALLKGTENV